MIMKRSISRRQEIDHRKGGAVLMISIKINTKSGKLIELEPDEAKQVYESLKAMFEQSGRPHVLDCPLWPNKYIDSPGIGYPPLVTYANTGDNTGHPNYQYHVWAECKDDSKGSSI